MAAQRLLTGPATASILASSADFDTQDQMSKKKSRTELEEENNFLRRARSSSAFASVANNLIRWGGLVVIFYWVYRSVAVLAGNTTVTSIGLGVFSDVKLSDLFGYLFGGSGVAYGLAQKRLRRRKVHHLQRRIKDLESLLDPKRSSSGLTTHGDTHPKDI